MGSGAFTEYCAEDKHSHLAICSIRNVYIVNIVLSILQGGPGSSMLWTGQFLYLSNLGTEPGKYFGIFFIFFQFTQISGNLFNYLYYTFSPNVFTYFVIFVVLSIVSSLAFIFLPSVFKGDALKMKEAEKLKNGDQDEFDNIDEEERMALGEGSVSQRAKEVKKVEKTEEKKKSAMEVISLVCKLFKNPRMRRLIPFMCLSGMMQGIPSLALYRITTRALKGEPDVEINKKISLTMGVLGTVGVLAGQYL